MAARLQIPFRECGAILVARSAEQAALLPEIYAKALSNGTGDCVRVLSAAEVFALEPEVARDVRQPPINTTRPLALSACLSACLSVCVSLCVSVCLSVRPCVTCTMH